jgi:type II secretory pathway pseudopilin PulG
MNSFINRMFKGGPEEGFTLVEVMVTIGILSFEVLAVLALYTVSIKANTYARRLTSATSLAQTGVESAKNTAYANLIDKEKCFDRNLGELDDCVADADDVVYTRVVDITKDSPIAGMAEVGVTVSWVDSSGNTHKSELISSISKY